MTALHASLTSALAWLAPALLFVGAFATMEGIANLAHRHVMHGVLWCWHRSHHEPRRGALERNDLFALLFALPSIALIYAGVHGRPWALAIGLGMTAYGAAYLVFHDGIVHRRLPMPGVGGRYLRRIVQAHHLHHALRTREHGLSFGFLWAPHPQALRHELRRRAAQARATRATRAAATAPRERSERTERVERVAR